jgi:hypothetical protein
MGDMRDILEAAAKTLRKSVGPCNLYDPNVCKFTVDSEHGWQPVVVAGAPFMHEVAFRRSGRRLTLFANADFVRIEVKGERPGEVFSVGRPNRVSCSDGLAGYLRDDTRWPVYVWAGKLPPAAIDSILSSRDLHQTVERLLRNQMESLHFFQDSVVLYLQPDHADTVLRAIEDLLSLVGPRKRRSVSDDRVALPKEFQSLAPFMERWAESDDAERSRILDKATPRSLRKLVDAVVPHFEGIDRYLSSFGDGPMPEAATQLQTLAECACEARLRLAKERER